MTKSGNAALLFPMFKHLTHRGLNEMVTSSQTTFSNALDVHRADYECYCILTQTSLKFVPVG